MRLAKETKTELHAWDESQAIIDSNGRALEPSEAGEYAQLLWDDGFIAEAFRYSNERGDSIDAKRSLYDFFVEKAEGLFLDLPADLAKRKRQTFVQTASMWGAYIGSPVQRQSLKFFWLEECIEGENPFVAETYHKILDAVARPALDRADIKLITKVTAVHMAGIDGYYQSRPRLETAGGDNYEFDELVITTPLGWLKRNRHAFKPALSPRLSQAIESIGYGTLDKVYITFPAAFWDTPQPTTQSCINGVDPSGSTPNVTATTVPLHQPSSQDEATHYPGFTHWLAPTYAASTNPSGWDQQGMNLAALPPSCAHPTLLFYIYGDCSKHIADLVSTSTSDLERDTKLLESFKPYYSRLPNYDSSNPACTPKAILATAWANDEFAGFGSYSNFQVGLEKGDEDIEVVRHGMPDRGLWFAGEHTAPFIALGTSTGAYWSGESVAKRILKAYRLHGQVDKGMDSGSAL